MKLLKKTFYASNKEKLGPSNGLEPWIELHPTSEKVE